MMVQIEGIIENIIFRNEANGFSVLELSSEGEPVTAVGIIPLAEAGEKIRLKGVWKQHRDYGMQLDVESYEIIAPTTLSEIEAYLGCGLIKGVGPATASNIVKTFGDKALEVLQYQPELLSTVKGIGKNRAEQICASYAEQVVTREIMMGLQRFGVSVNQAVKIYRVYGDDSVKIVRENPYRLINDIFGIGFKTADKIAANLGVQPHSPFRLSAGVKFILSWARNEGHSYLPYDVLIRAAAKELSADGGLVQNAVDTLILEDDLACCTETGEKRVYLRQVYRQENELARMLAALSLAEQPQYEDGLEDRLSLMQAAEGIELAAQQRDAVMTAATSNAVVITGGPGTGKTTIIKLVTRLYDSLGLDVMLCAPTGRAAKRMSEASGQEARTLHRLLEYTADGYVGRNEDNPVDAGAIIVDEMSMADLPLAYSLLRALKPGCRLVMVGDADQLPPVGVGNVLRDIISSGVLPVVRLSEIYRQDAGSSIVVNAHSINAGRMPDLYSGGGFFFDSRRENVDILSAILDLFSGNDPRTVGFDPLRDMQAVSPMKKNELGVNNLNRLLQQRLNPKSRLKKEKAFGELLIREGDKVMQIKNNYELEWERHTIGGVEKSRGVFNGDVGFVRAIDIEMQEITVVFDDERVAVYDFIRADELALAYCVSVHKSQGSEFKAIVMPVSLGPPMLMTRNLLYTALTRAKEKAFLVGRKEGVAAMVRNNHIARRYSGLDHALQSWYKKLRDRP
ncbi:MAG: ATP-dependent RecD-like DNA helicase [Christensenellales bacterium]|jgi:exodeoxyribonuclease V alpha subunit